MRYFIANSDHERLIDIRDELHVDRLAVDDTIPVVARLQRAPAGGVVGFPDDVANVHLFQIDAVAFERDLNSRRFISTLSSNGGNPPTLFTQFRMSLIEDDAIADVQRVSAGKSVVISGLI